MLRRCSDARPLYVTVCRELLRARGTCHGGRTRWRWWHVALISRGVSVCTSGARVRRSVAAAFGGATHGRATVAGTRFKRSCVRASVRTAVTARRVTRLCIALSAVVSSVIFCPCCSKTLIIQLHVTEF